MRKETVDQAEDTVWQARYLSLQQKLEALELQAQEAYDTASTDHPYDDECAEGDAMITLEAEGFLRGICYVNALAREVLVLSSNY